MSRSARVLVANWKMNLPEEGIEAFALAVASWEPRQTIDLVLVPPFPFLDMLTRLKQAHGNRFEVGAQNCSAEERGAWTGEVACWMLAAVGATRVIVGHSERRHLFDEDDTLVGRKLAAVSAAGLKPILCIGEEESVRQSGQTRSLLRHQIETALQTIQELPPGLTIAYEPVWAIGTGSSATAEMIAEAHDDIAAILEEVAGTRVPILYGGSVSADNAEELASVGSVDGFLVGGASLASSSFGSIYRAL
ncbi:MAG TPA: triose-phosphate isomerase [Thermoanaerobaculia bacterium]|nr:triose-phosphate isomerase [Thermoanaerobaculia bacterium]